MMKGRRTSRDLTLTGLVGLLTIFVASCSIGPTAATTGSRNPGAPRKALAGKQVFHFPLAGVPDLRTFDPAMATSEASLDAILMTFTGLVYLDDHLQIHPQMATSWKEAADGVTWTFSLKTGLKFSDGTPITSKDVVYSLDRALQPGLNSPASPSYLNLIKDSDKLLAGKIKTIIGDSLLAPDDHTVVIVTHARASYFLATLTYSTAYVVEKSLIDKYGEIKWTDHLTEGGGDGPFKVQEYTHGQRIVFIPNSTYYGPMPQLQEVIFTFVKDTETAFREYQVGSVDEASVPTAHLGEASTNTTEYHRVPILVMYYFGMNFLAKPFDNLKIRQAFALALNKDALIKAVFHDVNQPSNHIVPQGMPGYNPNLKGPDGTSNTSGNGDLARKLLQQGMRETGYSSVSALPAITLKYPGGSADIENLVAAAIRQWQGVLGVSVNVLSEDPQKLAIEQSQTVGNNSLQFFLGGWGADYPDPQDFLTLQFAKASANNSTNYGQNAAADASLQVQEQQLMAQADTMTDPTARMQVYNQAEQQLVNDVAWLSIFQLARSRLIKSYVVGSLFSAQDLTPPDDWSKVYIAAH